MCNISTNDASVPVASPVPGACKHASGGLLCCRLRAVPPGSQQRRRQVLGSGLCPPVAPGYARVLGSLPIIRMFHVT